MRERDFKRIAYRILDISAEGMQVQADERVLTGEPVIVSFRMPSTMEFVDAEAEVMRVIHGRRPGDRGPSLGLKFGPMPKTVRAELALSLRRLPPTFQQRAPRIDYAATCRHIGFKALGSRFTPR
ncbi:MAG: PilZ domain-containing protein [Polyangiales bacterium]